MPQAHAMHAVLKNNTNSVRIYKLKRELSLYYIRMMFDPGVRQACIDLTPTRKSDRRIKKQDLAIFRLQQYNRFLHVCLCPTATCLLPLLLYLIAEKHTKQHTCSKFRTDPHSNASSSTRVVSLASLDLKRGVARETKERERVNKLISIHKCKKMSCHYRMATKCTIQMLLLRAGDVELNPGPTRGTFYRVHGGVPIAS